MLNNLFTKFKVCAFTSTLIFSVTSFACINDSDTKFFEQQKFPGVQQLMAGDFVTHSKEFYAWRVKDRLEKIKKEPGNLAYYDDLAVSYEKSGDTPKAIETLTAMYQKAPNRYETLANLGTFYIHNKQYAKGLELLKKAIIINPDAHFGREVYQIKLVEYLLKENPNGAITFPVQKSKTTFADYLLTSLSEEDKANQTSSLDKELDPETVEILKALIGVGGMLKFGNSDSPVLLEAMGDLYTKLDSLTGEKLGGPGSTYFKKIALQFYAASIIQSNANNSNSKTDDIQKIYTQKFGEYLETKKLSTTSYPGYVFHSVENAKQIAKERKTTHTAKEVEYINKGSDVEKNIYTNLYPVPEAQQSLFNSAKEEYYKILNASRDDYYKAIEQKLKNLKDDVASNIYMFGTILGIYYIISLINFLKFIYVEEKQNKKVDFQKYSFKRLINVTALMIFFCLLYNTVFVLNM